MKPEVYLAWRETTPGQGSEDARKLLQTLYRAVTGEPVPTLEREPGGKPYFSQGSWHCSISHTRRAAFCVLSRSRVGLDAEPADRRVGKVVMERALSLAERREVASAPSPEEAFLTHWVLKEAYVKYTGLGLCRDLNALDFRIQEDWACLVGQPLSFGLRRVFGHIVAICTETEAKIMVISERA